MAHFQITQILRVCVIFLFPGIAAVPESAFTRKSARLRTLIATRPQRILPPQTDADCPSESSGGIAGGAAAARVPPIQRSARAIFIYSSGSLYIFLVYKR